MNTLNFNESAENVGLLTGFESVVFSDTSVNSGLLSAVQTIEFTDTASNTGNVTGAVEVTFSGSAVNTGAVEEAVFTGGAVNTGTVSTAVFLSGATNSGTVTNASFDETSINTGTVANSSAFVSSYTYYHDNNTYGRNSGSATIAVQDVLYRVFSGLLAKNVTFTENNFVITTDSNGVVTSKVSTGGGGGVNYTAIAFDQVTRYFSGSNLQLSAILCDPVQGVIYEDSALTITAPNEGNLTKDGVTYVSDSNAIIRVQGTTCGGGGGGGYTQHNTTGLSNEPLVKYVPGNNVSLDTAVANGLTVYNDSALTQASSNEVFTIDGRYYSTNGSGLISYTEGHPGNNSYYINGYLTNLDSNGDSPLSVTVCCGATGYTPWNSLYYVGGAPYTGTVNFADTTTNEYGVEVLYRTRVTVFMNGVVDSVTYNY